MFLFACKKRAELARLRPAWDTGNLIRHRCPPAAQPDVAQTGAARTRHRWEQLRLGTEGAARSRHRRAQLDLAQMGTDGFSSDPAQTGAARTWRRRAQMGSARTQHRGHTSDPAQRAQLAQRAQPGPGTDGRGSDRRRSSQQTGGLTAHQEPGNIPSARPPARYAAVIRKTCCLAHT